MPFVLVLCLVLTGLVGHQATLLTFERQGLEAQRMFLYSHLLMEKGEQKWWKAYMEDETSKDGYWTFEEGIVRYRVTPANGSDYQVVTLNAYVEDGGEAQHHYYVRKSESKDISMMKR